jgi:UDP-glucuronate decarboxylase
MIDSNPVVNSDLEHTINYSLPWDFFRNKTVLVTGGEGFLASFLVKTLLRVSNMYGLKTKLEVITRYKHSNRSRLREYISDSNLRIFNHDLNMPLPPNLPKAHIIIHSASQPTPKYYGTDPVGTLKTNSVGTMYLLDHAVRCHSEKFLFFSSGEVYGEQSDPNQEFMESQFGYLDPTNVRSAYAESKRMGETMCVAWRHQFDIQTLIVRPFHTYGPGMSLNDGRVFADFVADAVSSRDIVVRSDGLARRPFCYITDATLGFLTVLMQGESAQAYNIANPKAEVSIGELATIISQLFPEKRLGIKFEEPLASNLYLRSPITRQMPSIEKARSLGWDPVVEISNGFRRTILSYGTSKY